MCTGKFCLRSNFTCLCIMLMNVEHDKQFRVHACEDQPSHAKDLSTDLNFFPEINRADHARVEDNDKHPISREGFTTFHSKSVQ